MTINSELWWGMKIHRVLENLKWLNNYVRTHVGLLFINRIMIYNQEISLQKAAS